MPGQTQAGAYWICGGRCWGKRGEHSAVSHHYTFHETAATVSVLVLELSVSHVTQDYMPCHNLLLDHNLLLEDKRVEETDQYSPPLQLQQIWQIKVLSNFRKEIIA